MSLLAARLLEKPDPGFPILFEEDTHWTLSELRDQAVRLASWLQRQGVQPGDRVALMMMNQKEFLAGFFAILHVGAVVVPINITLPTEDIVYVILNSGSRLVLTTEALAACFEGKPIPILVARGPKDGKNPSWEEAVAQGDPNFLAVAHGDGNDLRVLMYTSGTTGKPKGVMLSENNLCSNMDGIAPLFSFQAREQLLLALPLFHAYGLIIALYALDTSAPMHLVPGFTPKKIIQTVITREISILPLVPTMFGMLLQGIQKAGVESFRHLKLCVSGGAPLPEKLLRQLEDTLNLTVLEGYGLTETAPVLAVNSRSRGSVPCSVGQPLPNVDLQLVDENGALIPRTPGRETAEGEILVKGPNVMLGYYNLPEETAQAFDPQGYFRTGDLGHLDAEGNLCISGGRKKDLIIKAGENISPVRIEEALHQHPAVLSAAVIGVPDEKLGEDIAAYVELKPGESVTPADLRKFCLERLSAFMTPAVVHISDALPKNQVGKILKNKLREQYGDSRQIVTLK